MKEIKAIIQPFMLTRVLEALRSVEGLPGITVDKEVRGFGRTDAAPGHHRILEDMLEYTQKVKLEIVVSDDLADTVVETIREHAHTGNPGDGKIFVIGVDDVVKIRTGERGSAAV